MKHSHIQTPRTMRDAFGEDTRLATERADDIRHWLCALVIGAAIGILIGLGI